MMGMVKSRGNGLDICSIQCLAVYSCLNLVGLAVIAHIGCPDQLGITIKTLFLKQPTAGLCLQFVCNRLESLKTAAADFGHHRADEIIADIGNQASIGGKHAGGGWNYHLCQAEFAAEMTGGHRAGATKCYQTETTRVRTLA